MEITLEILNQIFDNGWLNESGTDKLIERLRQEIE